MGKWHDMRDAFAEWSDMQTFQTVTKTVANYQVTETLAGTINFQAMIYPTSAQRLLIKPEGQRTWKFNTILTEQELILDDEIIDTKGIMYRVTAKNDYSNAGFYEYEIAQGYQ